MSGLEPVVRHFLVCERVEWHLAARTYSLHNLLYALWPDPGEQFPLYYPELWLFVQMTDGFGRHQVFVEFVEVDTDRVLFTTPPVTVNLGANTHRLRVRSWAKKLVNVPFDRPGLHEFRLWFDSTLVAQTPVVMEVPGDAGAAPS
jgi:hypothetical protein